MLDQCCNPLVNMPSSFVPWSCVMAEKPPVLALWLVPPELSYPVAAARLSRRAMASSTYFMYSSWRALRSASVRSLSSIALPNFSHQPFSLSEYSSPILFDSIARMKYSDMSSAAAAASYFISIRLSTKLLYMLSKEIPVRPSYSWSVSSSSLPAWSI